jgi:hypothetical protein
MHWSIRCLHSSRGSAIIPENQKKLGVRFLLVASGLGAVICRMSSSPIEEEPSGLSSVQGTTTTDPIPLHAAILDEDAAPPAEKIHPPVNMDDQSDKNETRNIIPEEECPFSMGDHIYQWCSVAFIPGIYQHHGIVLDVYYHDVEQEWVLKIVDFSNDNRENSSTNQKKQSLSLYQQSSSSCGGAVRTYVCSVGINNKKNGRHSSSQSSSSQWRIVQYSATLWQRGTWRAGTCTAVQSDPVGLVRARPNSFSNNRMYCPLMIPFWPIANASQYGAKRGLLPHYRRQVGWRPRRLAKSKVPSRRGASPPPRKSQSRRPVCGAGWVIPHTCRY